MLQPKERKHQTFNFRQHQHQHQHQRQHFHLMLNYLLPLPYENILYVWNMKLGHVSHGTSNVGKQ